MSARTRTIPFNMNHSVLVKLNQRGIAAHAAYYGDSPYGVPVIKTDSQGRSRWQMHELFRIFGGDAMGVSADGCLFDTNIELCTNE